MKVTIELAGKQDNQELLKMMAEMPMPGPVQVAYRREPNFFDALHVEGRTNQTIVGRDIKTGKLIGMGTRSIKPMYINGQKMNVGYLSSLRLLREYRKTLHLARGYKMLKKLHQGNRVQLYLSTMLNDNITARKLTRGRAHLPAYHDIGQFNSMAISLSQSIRKATPSNLNIRSATIKDIPLLTRFLNDEGKRRQFFPAYSESDFFNSNGLLQGIRPDDILMAFLQGSLKGLIAAWDQKAFRRSIVVGYPRWLSFSRWPYNMWARMQGFPLLPAVGSMLNYFYLSLVCIRDDDKETFLSLITELMIQKRKDYSFMMVGMHEGDPLLSVFSSLRHREYLSRIYVVCWKNGEELFAKLDGRVPYLEIGAL